MVEWHVLSALSIGVIIGIAFALGSVFIVLVLFFPLRSAVILSTIWGLITLTVISYMIARNRKENLYLSILEHIGISVMVIVLSNFSSEWIHSKLDI